MTKNDLEKIFEQIKKEREENLSEYQKIMQEYFPEHYCSPYDRFKKSGFALMCNNEEEYQKAWKQYNKIFNDNYRNEYVDDYRNPETLQWYSLFTYEMIYGEKSKFIHKEFIKKFHDIMSAYAKLKYVLELTPQKWYGRELKDYIDSKTLEFRNEDILITDPGYIIKEDSWDDWEKTDYGRQFEKIGITKYATKDTLYGDWGCTTWNTDTKEEIGQFCADAGEVSILSLDEVKKYNPNIENWCKEHYWCATIIRNFTGTAQIKIGYDEAHHDFFCYVQGNGSVNFYGGQTSI